MVNKAYLDESDIHPTVLIIDDSKLNVWMMREMLSQVNYTVEFALDGRKGLALASTKQPSLILLDINLPDMDGFEIYTELRKLPQTKSIPVIFMTAETDTETLLKGFEMGAVDYIKKPIHRREALARIQAHLTIHKLQKGLEHQLQEHEKLINDLSAFTHMVAHDLKNPLSTMMGFAELISEAVAQNKLVNIENYAVMLQQAGHKSYQIIDSLLLLANVRLKEVTYTAVSVQEVVNESLGRLQSLINARKAKIVYPESWPDALVYAPWLEEVWVNLLSNAIQYGGMPPIIVLGYTQINHEFVRYFVRDNGSGLSKEQQAQLFQPFVRFHKSQSGHGIGLSNVARIVERLGGHISVESKIDVGTTFYFTLRIP